MLSDQTLTDHDGVVVRVVRCRHPEGGLGKPSATEKYGVVVVSRGCFIRQCDGAEQVLDASMAYVNRPGHEERFAHPHAGGDECLVIDLEADRFAEHFNPDRLAVRTSIALTARVAVTHRLLLAAEEESRAEAALSLLREIAQCMRDPTQQPRAGRVSAHARRLVLEAREALADDPTLTLHELASKVSVSSHHLSRTFSTVTGRGVARHRTELRLSAALDRLVRGEDNLARLAADLGFADHAHLTRTLRRHTGRTPSQLRGLRGNVQREA